MFAPRYPVLGVRLENGPVVPLALRMEVCATQEEAEGNISYTFQKEYERLNEHLDTRTGLLHICGAGPSLEDSYEELSGDVLACNSALGFLLEKGITPRYAMIWDAHPLCANFAIPNPYVTYLLASRCHPSVFERLKDCNVIVWHAGGDYDVAGLLEMAGLTHKCEQCGGPHVYEPMVNGGSAAVTRALYLSQALGYREHHIHGGDSSYRGDRTHVAGSLVPEKRITVCAQRRFFDTTPEWAAQVEEFKCIHTAFKHLGAEIIVHGDGLLRWVWDLLQPERKAA